ncbi:DUF3793 family protein [Clostridiaceae bacterium]|nr:DUF3793 family protein [Clostridiaceae bacterium]RKI08651.1 DUF3793 family protein [bacterium 1XD21-70]
MSVETMLSFLNSCDREGRLGFQVAVQCAPVLKDVKISNLMTAPRGGGQCIRERLRQSRVICRLLYHGEEKEVLFLFRYERLEEHLKNGRVQSFLGNCGYEEYGVAAVLRRLQKRYQEYAGAGGDFPHELGVLLEYPVEDVEGFIANRGQNSLMARYWKVYHNRQEAERTFQVYDEAKEQALREIMRGFSLEEVAV